MQLTKKQIAQANVLIEKYGFPTLETQKELQENGFFEAVDVQHLIVDVEPEIVIGLSEDIGFYSEKCMPHILMPQFHEVWNVLPNEIKKNGTTYYLELSNIIAYSNTEAGFLSSNENKIMLYNVGKRITEAVCRLWLKLKKEGLI